MIQLVAFLGNHGRKYNNNRHNAGRMLAQELPFFNSLGWQKKFKGQYSSVSFGEVLSAANSHRDALRQRFPSADAALLLDENPTGSQTQSGKIHLVMPETFMNLSGESVLAAASFFNIKTEEIIVIHDELEIPLGTISLKFSSGLGGHNGLRSMKSSFGSADFWRLRLGIGRPDNRLPGEGGPAEADRGIADWVLSDFSGAERELFAPALAVGAGLLLRALINEPQTLLPHWAKKKIGLVRQLD